MGLHERDPLHHSHHQPLTGRKAPPTPQICRDHGSSWFGVLGPRSQQVSHTSHTAAFSGHLPCSLAFSQLQGDHKDCLPLLRGLIVLIASPTVSWMESLSYIIPTGAGNDRIHCFPSSPASIMVTKCLRPASKEERFQVFPLSSLSSITLSLWRGRASRWGACGRTELLTSWRAGIRADREEAGVPVSPSRASCGDLPPMRPHLLKVLPPPDTSNS